VAATELRRPRAQARRWTLGVVVSVAANTGFLAILALSGRIQSDYEPGRAIEVQLTLPTMPVARRNRPSATQTGPKRGLSRPAPRPAATATQPIEPTLPAAPATPAANADLAAALRRGLGCDHADFMALTPAEREHCRDRLAAATERASETASLGVEPGKRAIFEAAAERDRFLQHPFLAEKPKKGCRPRVAADNPASSAPGPQGVTFGVSCGVQF